MLPVLPHPNPPLYKGRELDLLFPRLTRGTKGGILYIRATGLLNDCQVVNISAGRRLKERRSFSISTKMVSPSLNSPRKIALAIGVSNSR